MTGANDECRPRGGGALSSLRETRDDGHGRREGRVVEERRADQRRPDQEVAGLRTGLAAVLPDDRRLRLHQVHLSGVPGRHRLAHVRPAPAHSRERCDLGRLLHPLHRTLPLHRPAPHGRATLAGALELRALVGVEREPGGGRGAPGPRRKPRLGSWRAAADQRRRDSRRARPAHRAVPDDHREPAAAGALRVVVVLDCGLRVDRRESGPAPARPLPHSGDQQRGVAWALHPLRRRPLDHAGGLRPHLLLSAGQREEPDLQPQALADRILVSGLLLSLRRHPPLPLLADRRLGRDDRDRVVHDADRPGVDRAPELLRDHDRPLATARPEPPRQVPHRGLDHVLDRLLPGLDLGAANRPAADPLHRLRHRPFPSHRLRHLRDVGHGRHPLRVAPDRRRRASLELPRRERGVLADDARHLGDGPGARGAGPAAGLHADGRRRVGALRQRHAALLVGADLHGHLDGYRYLAARLHPDEDVAPMRSIGSLAVGAGFFFVTLALFVQGFLPAMIPESRSKRVSRAVRTDLGDVKWLRYDASDYAPLERRGRGVYIREGCWYCHSQYVRPVAGEDLRWGPVSEAGEYAFDLPHLLSTRRIGPDLTRVGLKFGDDWHYAHHWDPRLVVPDSIMPSFKWLYRRLRVPLQKTEAGPALAPSAELTTYFTMKADVAIPLYPNAEGLTFVAPAANGEWPLDGTPVIDLKGFGDRPPALERVTLVFPTRELVGLVRYIQKLGTNRGAWREVFEPQTVGVSVMNIPSSPDLLTLGREVYHSRCVGCHAKSGDGNGLAATFLSPRPRNFTLGVFKFRTTPSGSLPTDGDLYRTVTRGVRWTAMPTWHELPDKERLAVVTFIKTFSRRWKDEQPEPPATIGEPPKATAELVARGKDLYQKAKCFQCHGAEGKGDGESAADLTDDLKFPIRPADFTRGQFKGGSTVRDIFRTMTLGLEGSADGRDPRAAGRGARRAQRAGGRRRPSALRPRSSPARADRGRQGQAADPVSGNSRMIEHLTLGAFAVALLMSLAAVCAFVWGAATGAFRGLERIKHQVLRAEGVDERTDV